MSLNMDKAIRGATKPKRAAPKKKYLDVLIPATARDDTLETMFMSLDNRMKEPTWTVVFKGLIVVHILARCDKNDRVLRHLVKYSGLLNVSGFKDKSGIQHGAEQNKNIHSYAMYLEEKVGVYRELKVDFTKVGSEQGGGRLRKLTVAKGLLREVKVLQRQLETLLNCKFYLDEINNEITLLAFNLLVKDLMALFRTVNEGVINVLDQYFEMSKIDAKDALQIYKTFCKQTEKVVDYLGAAEKIQHLGVSIPNLKHAPTSLTVSLEDYVNDPDFEINRQQYKQIKEERAKAQKAPSTSEKPVENKTSSNKPKNDSTVVSTAPLPTSSDKKISTKENKDFIDFFASIEQEHTVIFSNQLHQNMGTSTLGASLSTNPFLTMQSQSNQSPIHQSPIQQNPILQSPIQQSPIQQSPIQQGPIQQNLNQQKFQRTSTIKDTNPFRSSIYVQDPAPISPISPISQAVVPYQNPFSADASNPFYSSSSMNSEVQSQLLQQAIQPSITPSVTSTNIDSNPFRRLSVSPRFAQQTQFTGFHSQDSSTSSFQSTSSTFSQTYSGF